MSMSKKIYCVVFLLILLSLGILGLGMHNINRIGNLALDLVFLGNRSAALSNIDKQILERTIITREIGAATEESVIADLMKGRMAQTEERVKTELANYEANIPENATPEMRATVTELTGLWDVFVSESNKVGDLAVENTNNKAFRINEENVEFWEGVDKDLIALSTKLIGSADAIVQSYGNRVMGIRTDVMHLRLALVKYIKEADKEKAAQYKETILGIMSNVEAVLGEAAKRISAREGGDLAQALLAEKIDANGKKAIDSIVALVDRDTNTLANVQLAGPARAARIKMQTLTGGFLDKIAADQTEAGTTTDRIEREALVMMLSISLAGILLVAVLSWRIISGMVGRLNKVIERLGGSSEQVFYAAGQISNSSHSLAEGATEQAASLEETSSALEEMASMTRQNADNSTKTSATMSDTLKLVTEGADTVRNVTSAMTEISDSAEKIGNIIKTIEEIAFQTNLLALNAAVEAARAGEAGKGFAVVADEVRNLAQRSAQAAKDTSDLIQSTVERVRVGSENVEHLAQGFNGIEEASQNVGRLVQQISEATNEQAQGVDQVNTAVAQMDKVTQSNAASAEESASSAAELSTQADHLKVMVEDLIGLVEGRKRKVMAVDPNAVFAAGDDGAAGRKLKKVLALPVGGS